jgi:hypothetical protein
VGDGLEVFEDGLEVCCEGLRLEVVDYEGVVGGRGKRGWDT